MYNKPTWPRLIITKVGLWTVFLSNKTSISTGVSLSNILWQSAINLSIKPFSVVQRCSSQNSRLSWIATVFVLLPKQPHLISNHRIYVQENFSWDSVDREYIPINNSSAPCPNGNPPVSYGYCLTWKLNGWKYKLCSWISYVMLKHHTSCDYV